MSCNAPLDNAICVSDLHKEFPIYEQPWHRLMQMLWPRNRERWFRRFHALKGVSFDIRRGEVVGIVGRNGSGKSTLLQILCGTLMPSSGNVKVNGRIAALLELGAGFNPEFTGRENVYLNATILGLKREEIDARLEEILDFADIGEFIDQPVKSYSSGMYVRLAFAVAINVTPEILIVDEALSVGDEAFQRKCFARIEKICESGATVLFVSHSAGTVVDLCDRAILMDGGQVLMQGKPKQVVNLYQKLIYASPEQQPAIRQAIIEGNALPLSVGETLEEAGSASVSVATNGAQDDSRAWFDPGLHSGSEVAYQNKGASIRDVRVETLEGRVVNHLVHGEEYLYRYSVDVQRSLSRMRFGMMVRTMTGIELAGFATDRDDPGMGLVPAGATVDVVFRFRCLFNPGAFFLNAGCLADTGEGEDYVDRRIDVMMFRVMPERDIKATGSVNLITHTKVEWRV